MNSNSRNLMRALALVGALAATTVVGCDISKTLAVEPANLIPAVTLEAPENAALLVAGSASDFDSRSTRTSSLARSLAKSSRTRCRPHLAGHTISER